MKHLGSLMMYSEEREKDLKRVYDEYIGKCKYVCMPDVYAHIVNMPSKRFWVSETRATLVVNGIIRGRNTLEKMCPSKREMFLEIYNRFVALKEKYPQMSTKDLCCMVVNQPAPKFYLTPKTAKVMICKIRKKWMEEKQQKLLRLSCR